jgi:hypothetical protein
LAEVICQLFVDSDTKIKIVVENKIPKPIMYSGVLDVVLVVWI